MVFFFTLNGLPGQSSYLALGGLWCVFQLRTFYYVEKRRDYHAACAPHRPSDTICGQLFCCCLKKKRQTFWVLTPVYSGRCYVSGSVDTSSHKNKKSGKKRKWPRGAGYFLKAHIYNLICGDGHWKRKRFYSISWTKKMRIAEDELHLRITNGYVLRGNDGPEVTWAQRVSQRRRHCVLTRFKSNEIIEATSPLRLYRAPTVLFEHISKWFRRREKCRKKKEKKKGQKSYATSNDADVQSLGYYVAAACSILTIFSSFLFFTFSPRRRFPLNINSRRLPTCDCVTTDWICIRNRDKSRTEKEEEEEKFLI